MQAQPLPNLQPPIPAEVQSFDRPRGQTILTLIVTPFGALGFLAIAVALATGAFDVDLEVRIFGPLGFGFFGVMLALTFVSAIRRGLDRRVIQVSPTAFWLPATGWQPWDAIAEARIERPATSTTGRNGDADRQPRRLGFVLRDADVRPPAAEDLGWRIDRGMKGLIREVAPDAPLSDIEAAPFGVSEIELGGAFDRLVTAVGAYVTVVDLESVRSGDSTSRVPQPSFAIPNQDAAPEPDLRTLDARLAPPPAADSIAASGPGHEGA